MDASARESLHNAFCKNDVAAIRAALSANPDLKQLINAPIGPFDSPAICSVRSKEMLDLLLEHGADINAKSQWWAGGFCLLDSVDDALSKYAVSRGATVGIHQAARLGWMDQLRSLIAANASLVTTLGGDGKHPLHFARNLEVAKFLLDHGADLDAKDIDHESTPAQYLIGEHPEVARFLVERGAKTDIFLAAALGDFSLVQRHLDSNPNAIRQRIDEKTFPMSNPRAGGTIYNWTLGRGISPHQVAKKFGHENILTFLFDRSPPDIQLINFCWFHNEAAVKRVLANHPEVVSQIMKNEPGHLPDAARQRDQHALRLFLEAGLPIDARGQHNATALHWASWHGDAKSVELLLTHSPALELKDNDFNCTPLQWAMHGCENGWFCKEGDYPAVARLLVKAGATIPHKVSGTSEIQEAISSLR
jgi:ankyrin repeat protein